MPRDQDRECERVPVSRLLADLRAGLQGERVTLGEIQERLGPQAHGLLLLLLALPEALPLPIAGVSAIIAVPLLIVAVRLAVFGNQATLPTWLRRRTLPVGLLVRVLDQAAPRLRRLERVLRPRPPGTERLLRPVGVVSTVLAVVIALPIPFGNLPPAVIVVILALGLTQHDGVAVIVGFVLALLLLLGGAALVVLGLSLL